MIPPFTNKDKEIYVDDYVKSLNYVPPCTKNFARSSQALGSSVIDQYDALSQSTDNSSDDSVSAERINIHNRRSFVNRAGTLKPFTRKFSNGSSSRYDHEADNVPEDAHLNREIPINPIQIEFRERVRSINSHEDIFLDKKDDLSTKR
ncbi:hypothetical protein Ciccas_000966 [Cichlidogyrus casuarinus]|uniref:Uncharacterized protein n=1 Tax=Cichlidogyrus casuarinus TaxID=1844966 RepID=A0ABD2QLE6_9PLAT